MNTSFRYIRSILVAAAIGSPILLFVAFLLFARGLIGWAILPALIALPVLIFISSSSLRSSEHAERANPFSMWIGRIAALFCIFWLISLPEFQSLLDRLTDDGAFWDWRLILAVAIWTLNASFANWRFTRNVSDEEIFTYLNGASAR